MTHLIQEIVDGAVKLATRAAINGAPVARIVWVPPQLASQDPYGCFAVQECPPLTASDTPPWER